MTNLKEVTDSSDLFNLRFAVQQNSVQVLQTSESIIQLMKAWWIGESDFYSIELSIQLQIRLTGVMLFKSMYDSQIFLDTASTLTLAQFRMEETLDRFNAGKHWKYKGI